MTNEKSVPVLVTWDVDPDLWRPLEKRQWALNITMDLCHQLGIPATFFITAQPADVYTSEIDKMKSQRHEVGCHGLTHGNEEDYNRMPEERQRIYIKEATEKLQSLTGYPIRAFRSPRVKTSGQTLSLLTEYGYWADSSVCSQRLDLVSSNLINTNWILSPRRPYHPDHHNGFKKGSLSIWEIPVSAMVLPFISSALQVLGLGPMKIFFRLLLAESRRTGKPIVYLGHPIEFTRGDHHKKTRREIYTKHMKLEYFSPAYIKTHGLRVRNLLYRMNAEELLDSTNKLFAYMASFADVKFTTFSEYVQTLAETKSVPVQKRIN